MSLDEFTRAMIDEKLRMFCEHHAVSDLQDQTALTYSFWQSSVILRERRRSFVNPMKWIRVKIARADFDESSKGWTLWAYNRNNKPQPYPDLNGPLDFDTILGEIDRDPKCVFWV